MPKRVITMEIAPGGAVTIKGITDENGKVMDKTKCRKEVMDVGALFGEVKRGSEKVLPACDTKLGVEQVAG